MIDVASGALGHERMRRGEPPTVLPQSTPFQFSTGILRLRFNLPQPGVSIIRAAPHIDTVVCLTLAKRETVSGPFGGYLNDSVWRLVVNKSMCFATASDKAFEKIDRMIRDPVLPGKEPLL